jgi:hypothetical protein
MTHAPYVKIPVGTVGMMAAQMMSTLSEDDFLDIYDRGGYIVNGISLRQLALQRVACAAVELAKQVEIEMSSVR